MCVAAAGLVVVAMSATLVIIEGVLVAILPFGVLGILGTWGGSRVLRRGWGGLEAIGLDHEMVQEGLLQTVKYVDGVRVQPVEPIQGRSAESGREEEAHAFGRLERMYMGQRIFGASVEGDAEGLDVLFLVVIEDAFGKGPRSWFRPKGLVGALLLALQAPNLLKKKSHGRVGMRDSLECWRFGVWEAMGWALVGGPTMLGALGLVPLPVTLQGAIVMLQLDVLGMEMVILLRHPGDTGAEEFYLGLETVPHQRSLLGGAVLRGIALGIVAIFGGHGWGWGGEEATGPNR
ncbi:unnamed protein product [Prunus brigantina]